MKPISTQVRQQEAQHANQIRNVSFERRKLETAAIAKAPVGKQPNSQPRTLKLDMPKEVVARSQVKDERKGPPAQPTRERESRAEGKDRSLPKGQIRSASQGET